MSLGRSVLCLNGHIVGHGHVMDRQVIRTKNCDVDTRSTNWTPISTECPFRNLSSEWLTSCFVGLTRYVSTECPLPFWTDPNGIIGARIGIKAYLQYIILSNNFRSANGYARIPTARSRYESRRRHCKRWVDTVLTFFLQAKYKMLRKFVSMYTYNIRH